jgi:hypothetical protein
MATYTHRQELAKIKVTVVPIEPSSEFAKWRLLERFLQERSYGARAASVIASLRPDLVISGNTPIEIQAPIQKICRRFGTPFLFWLEDVYSIGVKSVLSKAPLIGDLIAARYALIERKVARQSDGVVAISDDFRDLAVDWGVDPRRIAVVENWGAISAESPPSHGLSPLADARGDRASPPAPHRATGRSTAGTSAPTGPHLRASYSDLLPPPGCALQEPPKTHLPQRLHQLPPALFRAVSQTVKSRATRVSRPLLLLDRTGRGAENILAYHINQLGGVQRLSKWFLTGRRAVGDGLNDLFRALS